MPVNLLAGEITGTTKKQGVNLLPELTGLYKDSVGEVKLPKKDRKEPLINDLGNAFMSGLNRTWATAARIPAGVYDLAAIPQNFLMKAIGRPELQVQSPEWLMDNPIAELYDYQTKAYRKEITPTKTFEEAFATKDFDGIGRHLAIQVAENAPQQIGIILSFMAGYPNVGIAGMGMLATTDSLKEGRMNKKDPAMSAYNSLTKGVIEAGFESIGTMGILKNWSKTLTKSFGTKNATKIMGDVFKTVFHSMLGEGNEEFWTSLAQDFSDYTTGIKPDAMKGSLVRAYEAGAVGGISGGLLTGPGAIKIGHASASMNKMKADVEQVRKTLEEEGKLVTPEVLPKVKIEVVPEVEKTAPSVISFINDKGEKVFTKLTPEELAILEDEVKNIPRKSEEAPSQIHLDAITPALTEIAKEISREEFIAGHPQAQEVFDKAKIKPTEAPPKAEVEVFAERVKAIREKFKRPETIAKKEVKLVQEEIIKGLERSDLEAKDKAKFIKTIKNVQTAEQLQKALPIIEQRIERLTQAAKKTRLETQIKRELKTTKPLKKGQRRVGKFDIETNRFFNEIRSFNKLNQSQAQAKLDALPEEATSEIDLIKKRFLSLKANGKEASVEIFSAVNEDIKRMKALGKQAKDAADFEMLLQRQERVDEALAATGRIKANKKTIKTKIANVYRKGFANIYSMLNSLFGKTFAEQYDPEISENRRNTAVFFKTKAMTEEIKRIYVEKNASKVLELLAQKEFNITDIEGLTTELSKLELIDIYNSLKNDKKRDDFYNAFGEEQVQTLLGNLEKQDEAFADYLQEVVQSYREVMNVRNIEITGRDLGFVENYWPATSEFVVSVIDDIRIQGETPSAAKERAKGRVIPVPKNAWLKAQKHVAQAEHVSNLSRQHETLKRMFTNRKVKHAIKEKFGNDVYNVLMDQIDNISLNAQSKKIDAVSQWFGIAINNWVTSKIALNPSTYIRQLMSVGNYIEVMDSGEWVEGFRKGILSPKQTFDFMWKNAPFLEARFNRGYSEALKAAIEGAEKLSGNWSSYTKFLSSLARHGDISAIVYGGFPLVQAELAKGKTMKQAITTFEKATLKAQQSGLSSSISQFQNSRNPFARLFLAFKNTSNQYFRKMGDAMVSKANGDISNAQFAKTMLIYMIIQPIMYASSGFMLKEFFKGLGNLIFGRPGEDQEEIAEKWFLAMITQIAVAPVNAIPVIDDIAMAVTRKLTGQKVWKIFSIPLFDDFETGMRAILGKELTAEDYLTFTASVLEPVTAAPLKVFMRIFDHITGRKKKGGSKAPAI